MGVTKQRGRPRMAEEKKLSHMVNFRITQEEFDGIEMVAKDLGLKVSDVIRAALDQFFEDL